MPEMPIKPITSDAPPPARAVVYEATCAQDGCGFVARGTFEEFPAAGWVIMVDPATGKTNWFCPGCVHGIKPVGSVDRRPVAQQPET